MAHTRVAKLINGNSYDIGTLPIPQARAVFVRLSRVLGPVVGEFLVAAFPQGAKGFSGLANVEISAVGRALQDLCLRLDEQDLKFISEAFAAECLVNRKPMAALFDVHFAGMFGEMFEWLSACILHNYSDFFRLLTSGLASRSASLAAPTVSE